MEPIPLTTVSKQHIENGLVQISAGLVGILLNSCFPRENSKRTGRYCGLERFDLLPLASFGSARYILDEVGAVKCVCKAGCAIRACIHIAAR